ncbi:MAG: NAD-dependent DNA ligase LigA [Pseudomonadota bacterium]
MSPPPNQAVRRHEQLVREITEHDSRYYVQDAPTISDRDYDRLMKEIVDLEAAYPELKTEDSPTSRVGAPPLSDFKKVPRKEKMMSLDNTYNEEELRAFVDRVFAGLGTKDVDFAVEPKIDGLGIELTYEKGRLVLGATRGDGLVGEDVTENLKTIRSIPLRLAGKANERTVHIRGEVYIERNDLDGINVERAREGLPEFKNPRNAAAGSLRLLDSSLTARRPLRALFYHLLEGVSLDRRHSESMDRLKKWGLPINKGLRVAHGAEGVLEACTEWREKRHKLPFDVDGLVMKVDRYDQQTSLGATSKYPRWAIAFKYEAERAETRVLDIRVQVGRTGVLTPVADLEPVLLAGTTVSHASLHNAEEIERKDVRIGDRVVIEKAGEIIPQVVQVLKDDRSGKERKFQMPSKCPDCGGPVGKTDEEEVATRCLNGFSCPAQLKEAIRYFATRRAMNVDGLGPALVDQLVDQGLVKDPSDLFSLKFEDLAGLERMADKSAQNIQDALEVSRKNATLARLLTAIGIPQVGEVAAAQLAEHAKSIDYLLERPKTDLVNDLSELHGIGPKMAAAIAEFFANARNRKILQKLKGVGINPKEKGVPTSGKLKGLAFCITGTLSRPRDKLRDEILRAGGKWSPSVTSKTDYLVAGENAGSKLAEAQKKGVKVLSEAELAKMLG